MVILYAAEQRKSHACHHKQLDCTKDCCCRFADDQTFSALQGTALETMDVVDGTWYVSLKGDYAGRVSGAVYDLRNSSDPVQLVTTVSLQHTSCKHVHMHVSYACRCSSTCRAWQSCKKEGVCIDRDALG